MDIPPDDPSHRQQGSSAAYWGQSEQRRGIPPPHHAACKGVYRCWRAHRVASACAAPKVCQKPSSAESARRRWIRESNTLQDHTREQEQNQRRDAGSPGSSAGVSQASCTARAGCGPQMQPTGIKMRRMGVHAMPQHAAVQTQEQPARST